MRWLRERAQEKRHTKLRQWVIAEPLVMALPRIGVAEPDWQVPGFGQLEQLSPNLSQFRLELLFDRFDQKPVTCVHFVIAQGAIVGTILKANCDRAFVLRNSLTFVGPHKLRSHKVRGVLRTDRFEDRGQTYPSVNE
jgi:hypothetical protein